MDIVLLVGSLAIILIGAELFTNGIEWFGHKLNLAEGAVGSVLAAVATAMPETLIPIIAIVGPVLTGSSHPASAEVGVGAILGAPFMLATLAMFITGLAIILFARGGRRGSQMVVNVRVLGRDVGFFIVAYGLAIGAAFLPTPIHWLKWVVAPVLLILYAVYVRAHFTDEPEEGEASELNRLHLTRLRAMRGSGVVDVEMLPHLSGTANRPARTEPRLRIIVAQVLVALALIILGARTFVGAVEHLSTVIGLDGRILALIIAPIATELPEKFNSVIWVRARKDTLAMGNITGAMVFQSCVPTVLGVLFTDWVFTAQSALSFASAGAAFVATILIFGSMLRRGVLSAWSLLIGGPIYVTYVAAALFLPVGAAAGH
ncbi:MAG: sodium:calcium antiporter [Chloroflexota bacterium]|nr:sodium:calcium antiporter [Chloroflexota bacterium]